MSTSASATIYSTATCAYCYAEKQYLTKHNVPFTEVRVDADAAAAKEMVERSGQMGVPFTVVSDAQGETIDEIVGFDQPRLEKALGL